MDSEYKSNNTLEEITEFDYRYHPDYQNLSGNLYHNPYSYSPNWGINPYYWGPRDPVTGMPIVTC